MVVVVNQWHSWCWGGHAHAIREAFLCGRLISLCLGLQIRCFCAVCHRMNYGCLPNPNLVCNQDVRAFASIGWTCVMRPLGKVHSWLANLLFMFQPLNCPPIKQSFCLQSCGKVANGTAAKTKWRRDTDRFDAHESQKSSTLNSEIQQRRRRYHAKFWDANRLRLDFRCMLEMIS